MTMNPSDLGKTDFSSSAKLAADEGSIPESDVQTNYIMLAWA